MASAAQAQPGAALTDPMRPPAASAPSAPEAQTSAPGVQVILTSPERSFALIDGEVVPLGGKARGGTLVGLTDSSAVLRKNGSRDVLLMHPAIDKRPSSSAAAR